MMNSRKLSTLLILAVFLFMLGGSVATAVTSEGPMKRITPDDRKAAAARAAEKKESDATTALKTLDPFTTLAATGYFNVANYANSPLPILGGNGQVVSGTGVRKFIDVLPGLGSANANNLGQYLPVAIPDQTTYPGCDYYAISLVEYTEKLHSDLPATKLRGYVQTNTTDPTVSVPHYLGPLIIANKNRPVRVKFTNTLPTGSGGNLFIPTDTTVMGAGMGPNGTDMYTQNRATLHLHGGATPWISDGTPHQWTTPATETTPYPKGVSVQYVPDMWFRGGNVVPNTVGQTTPPLPGDTNNPGDGSLTFYYTNQQSARLMFYHDHAYGLTRLNVYGGEAAGYLLNDPVEQNLVAIGTIPSDQIPLIIQDKTFVPDPAQLAATDPTWDSTNWGGKGNLWFPHVYMTNQNPADAGGVNPFGRWDYGPWFWPPVTTLNHMPVGNVPATPNPSLVPEAFMDTPLVNGTAYPYLKVDRKAYRLRILNASNDRTLNLQLYFAKSNIPDAVDPMTGRPTMQKNSGEVRMVPATPHPGDPSWPATWPTDGRDGGVPDPSTAGPKMIQVGTEGGFLPAPVVLDNTPVGYNYNRRDIVVLNVSNKTLMLGPAERADVIVDFSQVPAGSRLILYNDAPAPVPAFDPRYDYYTGDPDQTSMGGAPTTLAGYGPNTRTIMQFQAGTDYVESLYEKILGRVADPGGYSNWIYALNLGISRTAIAQAILFSSESHLRMVGNSYMTILGRTADPGGLQSWTLALDQGLPLRQLQASLYGSAEYTTTRVVNAGNQEYVNSLYQRILGRGSDPGGLAAWTTALNNGATRSSVAMSFLSSAEYFMRFITTQYIAILGRSPDPGGLAAWTNAMVIGLSETDLMANLYGSQEFLGAAPGPAYNIAALQAALPVAYAATQEPPIVTQAAYNAAFGTAFPDTFSLIQDTSLTYVPFGTDTAKKVDLQPKAIQELFELDYGRMNATLGVELPFTNFNTQTTIPLGYKDPITETLSDSVTTGPIVTNDGTQIWKITHNGVDTHAIHFHLFNVQVVNRVGWDGAIRPTDPNELGWKETIRMNPLEDCIVALRPVAPAMPFQVPNSVRPLDPTMAVNAPITLTNPVDGNPITVPNAMTDFGWEYVWHCHLLGHEENDMMRPVAFTVAPTPNTLLAAAVAQTVTLNWTNPATNMPVTTYTVQRATNAAFTTGVVTQSTPAPASSFNDPGLNPSTTYYYRVRAENLTGYSPWSNAATVTTGP